MTELILKLKERKKSIVLIEHNLPITMKVCDRIMVLSYGKKIAEGPPEAVKHGIIGDKPLGENGFGYDPIFFLPEYQKSSTKG